MPDLRKLLARDVLRAAPALLGTYLVRGPLRARIVEVEAYRSADDPASHAYRSRTKRNDVMFGPPGRAYVYFNYGVHWMLNVVAHAEGNAAAVLIRAAEPLEGLDLMRTNRGVDDVHNLLSGPGKLCKAFGITAEDNGRDLFEGAFRLEPGEKPKQILAGPRVGITVGTEHPWRFMDAGRLEWVSRPRPKIDSPAIRRKVTG